MNLYNRWRAALAELRRARIGTPEFDAARSQLLAVYRAYNLTRP